MAFPVAAVVGAIPGVAGLFKKKRYVLWVWSEGAWQAVAEGTSKTIKKADKEWKASGNKTIIKKAGVTPAPLTNERSDSTTSPWVWIAIIGGGLLIFVLKFRRKR